MNDEGRKTVNFDWRWNASALALLAAGGGAETAMAAPVSNSGLTIDFQGQYALQGSNLTQLGQTDVQTPAQVNAAAITKAAEGPSDFSNPTIGPSPGYDIAGSLTYQPPGSPISFAFNVRYGRTSTHSKTFHSAYSTKYGTGASSALVRHTEEHFILDFEIGKDVGVGLWGPGVTTVSGGIRYAHFETTTRGSFSTTTKYFSQSGRFTLRRLSDFTGPVISIKQTSVLPGHLGDEGFSFEWGATGAVLFGRQAVNAEGFASSNFQGEGLKAQGVRRSSFYGPFQATSRDNSAISPDLSGFAQLNWSPKSSPLTIGVGYRIDDYFGAIDGGFNTVHRIDIFEHGPYLDLSYHFR